MCVRARARMCMRVHAFVSVYVHMTDDCATHIDRMVDLRPHSAYDSDDSLMDDALARVIEHEAAELEHNAAAVMRAIEILKQRWPTEFPVCLTHSHTYSFARSPR